MYSVLFHTKYDFLDKTDSHAVLSRNSKIIGFTFIKFGLAWLVHPLRVFHGASKINIHEMKI
jgi:hypothetical protein